MIKYCVEDLWLVAGYLSVNQKLLRLDFVGFRPNEKRHERIAITECMLENDSTK